MKYAIFWIIIIFEIIFIGCAAPRDPYYSAEKTKQFEIDVSNSKILEKPSRGKARIYILRESAFVGSGIDYSTHIEFYPSRSANKIDALGMLENGWSFYIDVKPNIEINISLRHNYNALALFATLIGSYYPATDINTFFTPLKSKVYCFNAMSVELVDKQTCEKIWGEFIENRDDMKESYDEQFAIREKYLQDPANPRLPDSFVVRSFEYEM